MKRLFWGLLICHSVWWSSLGQADTLQLHPKNPHYFEWNGKPTVLISSGEHYGALINLDFDFDSYLKTLEAFKLNHTRLFTGAAYVEPHRAFRIARNTLAPFGGRFLSPYARSARPGFGGGGNRFDLTAWEPNYFGRLHRILKLANRRGIIVEINLFSPITDEKIWQVSPYAFSNNVNGLGEISRNDLFTLDKSGGLLAVQENFVRKIVDELKDYGNIYYEIMNEPYAANVPDDWQRHMTDVLVDAQKTHRHPKLISWNIASRSAQIQNPHPAVSIFNFHYAAPPTAVELNYDLYKVIGDNQTGFRGTTETPYRFEAWNFMLAGGGLFSHLDYSFASGSENGTFILPAGQPGGGGVGIRLQLEILRRFMHELDFLRMKPDNSIIHEGLPDLLSARALADPGREYAIYLHRPIVTDYSVRWTGEIQPTEGGDYVLNTISKDGVRVWVNGQRVIDNWTEHKESTDRATVHLMAGQRHTLRVEYFYTGGNSVMQLLWSHGRKLKLPVPSAVCWLPGTNAHGLTGEYFLGTELQQLWRTRVDPQINFNWGTSSPFPAAATENVPVALELEIPAGHYRLEWMNPMTGVKVRQEKVDHAGGTLGLKVPLFSEDIALHIRH